MRNKTIPWVSLAAIALIGACGGKGPAPADGNAASADGVAANAAKPTGTIVTIQMIADEKGSRFEPAEIVAHRGDVLRFTLGVGVHNVHFLPDSNAGVANLPEPSDMLQLPGQTFDLPVNLPAGRTYYFQCDPHLALGMKGHLKVE